FQQRPADAVARGERMEEDDGHAIEAVRNSRLSINLPFAGSVAARAVDLNFIARDDAVHAANVGAGIPLAPRKLLFAKLNPGEIPVAGVFPIQNFLSAKERQIRAAQIAL